ncbi:hypothetical protein F2Q68_00031910 [Brassica cretica]|uniref:Uncharacterized protein n=1 Tax=Brassica cretica TaxID=69181 RepID=A0A8S9GIP0_BRACR|nr:hypothetical protein F2Q68_00031910 [Brassica cretica]
MYNKKVTFTSSIKRLGVVGNALVDPLRAAVAAKALGVEQWVENPAGLLGELVGVVVTAGGGILKHKFVRVDARMWMMWLCLHTQGSFVVRQVVARCCTLSHPNEVLWLGKLWSRCSQRRDVRKTVVVASWWMRGGGCCGCGIGGDIGT